MVTDYKPYWVDSWLKNPFFLFLFGVDAGLLNAQGHCLHHGEIYKERGIHQIMQATNTRCCLHVFTGTVCIIKSRVGLKAGIESCLNPEPVLYLIAAGGDVGTLNFSILYLVDFIGDAD